MKLLTALILLIFLCCTPKALAIDDRALYVLLIRAKAVQLTLLNGDVLTTMAGQRLTTMKGN